MSCLTWLLFYAHALTTKVAFCKGETSLIPYPIKLRQIPVPNHVYYTTWKKKTEKSKAITLVPYSITSLQHTQSWCIV
jgi:hypothetical protein